MANRRGKIEAVTNFLFLGSKVTVDGDCGHEIQRHLLLERKVITKLDSVLKSRNITLSTKVHIVKVMVFPVVMYRCESWTVKKEGCHRVDTFKLCYWKRFLRLPWTAKRSNQSILKEINPEYTLEGLMLKLYTLATWWEEPTHWKRPWCWERLRSGGKGGYKGWGG